MDDMRLKVRIEPKQDTADNWKQVPHVIPVSADIFDFKVKTPSLFDSDDSNRDGLK